MTLFWITLLEEVKKERQEGVSKILRTQKEK